MPEHTHVLLERLIAATEANTAELQAIRVALSERPAAPSPGLTPSPAAAAEGARRGKAAKR